LERHRYFPAFFHGLAALAHFDEAKEEDPGIHDIAFATGLFKYYRSVKTRYLWFLPLVRDQREEGIEEIGQVLDRGHFAVPAAKIALVVLAEKEGKDLEGIGLGETYLKDYPQSLLIRHALAMMYERQERWSDAGRTYRRGYGGDRSIRWVLLRAGSDFARAAAWDEAEESLQAYLASGPVPAEEALAHRELSRIYRIRGESSRSREALERALLLDPAMAETSTDVPMK
jgi:tetratricopeptide (TPR) repeat protein